MPKSKFSAHYQNLDGIREFVGEVARQADFTEKEVFAIQLATDEASTNIIEHAYADDSDGVIEIQCHDRNGEFVIIMRDQGRAFDPSSVPEPNLQAELAERKVGGLGMYLIRKLMDDVQYESMKDGGNILTLIKRRETVP